MSQALRAKTENILSLQISFIRISLSEILIKSISLRSLRLCGEIILKTSDYGSCTKTHPPPLLRIDQASAANLPANHPWVNAIPMELPAKGVL